MHMSMIDFQVSILLGPLVLATGERWIPLHDALGVKSKLGAITDIKTPVSRIWALQ